MALIKNLRSLAQGWGYQDYETAVTGCKHQVSWKGRGAGESGWALETSTNNNIRENSAKTSNLLIPGRPTSSNKADFIFKGIN